MCLNSRRQILWRNGKDRQRTVLGFKASWTFVLSQYSNSDMTSPVQDFFTIFYPIPYVFRPLWSERLKTNIIYWRLSLYFFQTAVCCPAIPKLYNLPWVDLRIIGGQPEMSLSSVWLYGWDRNVSPFSDDICCLRPGQIVCAFYCKRTRSPLAPS